MEIKSSVVVAPSMRRDAWASHFCWLAQDLTWRTGEKNLSFLRLELFFNRLLTKFQLTRDNDDGIAKFLFILDRPSVNSREQASFC